MLHWELARILAGLGLEIEQVLSPASEVESVEADLVVAVSESRRAAAWTALHRAEVVAVMHYSPGDQLSNLEWKLRVTLEPVGLLKKHLPFVGFAPSVTSADFA